MNDQVILSEAMSRASDPMQLMQRVVDQALALIDGADGALVALWDRGEFLTYVCGSGHLAPHVGLKLCVGDSLSGLAVQTGQVVDSEDTAADPRVNAEACRNLKVASTVCVPLVRGSRSFGVLNVSSSRRRAFCESDTLILGDLAEFVSIVIGAASDLDRATRALFAETRLGDWGLAVNPGGNSHSEEREGRFVAGVLDPQVAGRLACRQRIESVLERAAFSMVFQPVITLADGGLFGYEALARFSDEPVRTPDVWFAEAHLAGLGVDLELAAVELALAHQPQLPGGVTLAVNAGPDAITSPKLIELLHELDASRVIVELTEHVEVADYPYLVHALGELRASGARLAIDDTGAGSSSLAHILKLSPDFIKLDRALTTGIDQDPVRRALAASLVSFAADTGSVIVAEGIETEGELDVLRDLGISHGQGYHLGYPAPLAS